MTTTVSRGGKHPLLGGATFNVAFELPTAHTSIDRLIVLLPFGALASTATLAPRIEILTILACSVIKPEIFDVGKNSSSLSPFVSLVQLVNSTGLASPGSGIPQTCAQDPDVQAAVAQLSAGGYWFLLVGPIIEGSVGGTGSSSHSLEHGHHNFVQVSHVFSILRPHVHRSGIGTSVRKFAYSSNASDSLSLLRGHRRASDYASMVWFIVPESLTKRQMHEFKVKHIENEAIFRDRDRSTNSLATEAIIQIRNLLRFLRPLAIFFPTMVETKRGPRRDWSLALVAASYGFTISIMGSYVYKFQYAASAFGWSAETVQPFLRLNLTFPSRKLLKIGYWISLVGAVRAAFLALILPGKALSNAQRIMHH
ncbi:MFS substrate transporter [Salix suchowensis]|nr:MFS substrate transporter [Salix suchowensis]